MAMATVVISEGKAGEYGERAWVEAFLGGMLGLGLGLIFARNPNRSRK